MVEMVTYHILMIAILSDYKNDEQYRKHVLPHMAAIESVIRSVRGRQRIHGCQNSHLNRHGSYETRDERHTIVMKVIGLPQIVRTVIRLNGAAVRVIIRGGRRVGGRKRQEPAKHTNIYIFNLRRETRSAPILYVFSSSVIFLKMPPPYRYLFLTAGR